MANSLEDKITNVNKDEKYISIASHGVHDDRGNPRAIYVSAYAGLDNRQQNLLSKFGDGADEVAVKKSDVSMNDLAALTAYTNVEYAMFSGDSERIIVRGRSNYVEFTEIRIIELSKNGYKFSGHTHADDSLSPSLEDFAVLSYFDQKESAIYNRKGEYHVFANKERGRR